MHRALKRAILERALEPGTKLPEDSIGERFGVSRTLVREALVRLREEGLVELRPNRGAVVTQPSLEDGRDLFSIRFALENLVVETLTGNLTKEQQKTLSDHIASEDKAEVQDEPSAIRLAGEFHICLAAMTGNQTLERYINELVSRSSLILSLYGRHHSVECAVNEHKDLLAAMIEGDKKKACEIMKSHLTSITTRAVIDTVRPTDIKDILAQYADEEGLSGRPA